MLPFRQRWSYSRLTLSGEASSARDSVSWARVWSLPSLAITYSTLTTLQEWCGLERVGRLALRRTTRAHCPKVLCPDQRQ